MAENRKKAATAEVIPLYAKDELNLVEWPLCPLTPTDKDEIVVSHVVRDRVTRREVTRQLRITASKAHGFLQPVDDRVLVGLLALSSEGGFSSRTLTFSAYRLLKTIGWTDSGASYLRLVESLDRITGMRMKFQDAWWDLGEQEFKTHGFGLIDNYTACSRNALDRARIKTGECSQSLWSITWNQTLYKSFNDGYLSTLDMEMFRKITNGKKRDAAFRLWRWLVKKFWDTSVVSFDVLKLATGTIGLNTKYRSEAKRTIDRAAKVLQEVGFLEHHAFELCRKTGSLKAIFIKAKAGKARKAEQKAEPKKKRELPESCSPIKDPAQVWVAESDEKFLVSIQDAMLADGYGSRLEQKHIALEIQRGIPVKEGGLVRKHCLFRYFIEQESDSVKFIAGAA